MNCLITDQSPTSLFYQKIIVRVVTARFFDHPTSNNLTSLPTVKIIILKLLCYRYTIITLLMIYDAIRYDTIVCI